MYAVWYAIRGRVAEWVPTGASPDGGQVPVTVNRILCTWIVLVQVLLWSGLALRVHEYGWQRYWATEVLAGVQLYMLAPLMTPSKGVWKRASAEGGSSMRRLLACLITGMVLASRRSHGGSQKERSYEASQR